MRKDKTSMTARKVAANIVTLGQVPAMAGVLPAGLVETTAKLLVASGAVGVKAMRWVRSAGMVKVYRAFDPLLPGQFEAFGYRKAFCDRQVRGAIATGATQVLVLGAGYDTLAWRLAPEFPDVDFFEVDHPPTARRKARGIAAMGQRGNLHLLAQDLAEKQLTDVLNDTQEWDSRGQTVIIAEGLVLYLPPDAVADLFRQCAAVAGPESRIAFSYIPMGADGRPDAGKRTGLMLWLQKLTGEPWLSSIAPDELGEFLGGTGWRLTDVSPKRGVEFYVVATR